MKRKSFVWAGRLACVTAALMLGLTACGATADDEGSVQTEEDEGESKKDKKKKDKNKDKKESTQESESGEETGSEEDNTGGTAAGENEPEEESREGKVLPIELYTQKAYDNCWEEGVELALMSYNLVCLSEETAVRLPELEKTLAEWNESVKTRMTTTYEEYIVAAKEHYRSDPDYFYSPYSVEQKTSVLRSDDRVLSLELFGYDYSGGAHGYYCYTGYTVDAVTGKELAIGDVMTDTEALPELIYNKLTTENPDTYFWEETKGYLEEAFSETETTLAWSLDYTGLTFYFNPYEIASYADGVFEVTFDFAGYPELFQKYYTEVPDSYVVRSNVYDLDGDGEADTYYVDSRETEYGDCDRLYISINDTTIERETWAWEVDYSLIHTKDAGNYLYVALAHEDDYKSLEVYDMNGSEPIDVGSLGNVGFETVYLGDDRYGEALLTNPENFRMRSRMEIMSSYSGYKDYRVGDDGIPVSEDVLYHTSYSGYPNWSALATKQDVTGVLVDEEGRETGNKYTIPSGTEVTICATDGKSFVDLRVGEEKVRVYVVCDIWPQTIDGVDIEELFDGILFAG